MVYNNKGERTGKKEDRKIECKNRQEFYLFNRNVEFIICFCIPVFIYLGICLYLEGTKVHLRLRLYFNDFLYFVQQPFVVLHDVYHCIYLF